MDSECDVIMMQWGSSLANWIRDLDMAGNERVVVRRHFAKLTQAVQDPLHLAHELYQEGILAQSLIGQIRGMNDRTTHKNSLLMEAVHDQVTTPTRFHQFLDILKKEESLASTALSMQSLYGKLNKIYI